MVSLSCSAFTLLCRQLHHVECIHRNRANAWKRCTSPNGSPFVITIEKCDMQSLARGICEIMLLPRDGAGTATWPLSQLRSYLYTCANQLGASCWASYSCTGRRGDRTQSAVACRCPREQEAAGRRRGQRRRIPEHAAEMKQGRVAVPIPKSKAGEVPAEPPGAKAPRKESFAKLSSRQSGSYPASLCRPVVRPAV